jgi:hypothetical protein
MTSQSWIEFEEIEVKNTLMHHCQPRPTIRTSSFQQQCAKGVIAMESYHHPQKFAQACRYLPKVTRIIFFKKKKKKNGGTSTICLRPFVRGNINRANFVSLKMLHIVDKDM